MAVIDVSRQRRSFLSDLTVSEHLPAEIQQVVKDQSSPRLLDAVSEAALIPSLTERVYAHFEPIFPDICARWILNAGDESRNLRIVSAFSRILPFSPYLSEFLSVSQSQPPSQSLPHSLRLSLRRLEGRSLSAPKDSLVEELLSVWRLISFDRRRFRRLASSHFIQQLFNHEDCSVRYLAVRIFCQLLHASDFKLEQLIEKHVGKDISIMGFVDGQSLDLGFLSLYEHTRVKRTLELMQELQGDLSKPTTETDQQALTPYVIRYGRAILPRPHGPLGDPESLVMTITTVTKLERLARLLQNPEPILLHGLPGTGKTSLVHEIAKQLGTYSNMVTLHLNEQTDAKMLIGLYSTDSKPGSFQWRPGVLTTAVREGRWVLVEDLDRAPIEVLSTLLPLIERKELLIPSRGETIRASDNFRLFATMRTAKGLNGRETMQNIVGMRFWQSLYAAPLETNELEQIALKTFPVLRKYVPGILGVYNRLIEVTTSSGRFSRGRGGIQRQIGLRDLLKWCRRLRECLLAAGKITGEEAISETTRDWMFMEAIDCFVGSCSDEELRKQLVYAVAEEMQLSKDRADHYLTANIPPLEDSESRFRIGRVQLRKQKSTNRLGKSKRPFASTAHAKKVLEQIAAAVNSEEPILLVGETGIGKTTVVQQLAETLGHKLIAVNLSQQSEVGDLLGGFKPVNIRSLAVPLKEEFEDLFSSTGISASKNQKYLESVGKCFAREQWPRVSKLWKEAPKMFRKIVEELERRQHEGTDSRVDNEQRVKRRKTSSMLQSLLGLRPRWELFARNLEQFDVQLSAGSGAFAFSFVEGNLVKAVRNGDWILLDEINLASPDTLESIADLLTGPNERPTILLSETGEIDKIVAHPNFRIFAAMNPATDVGKRDLPIGIRSRFTELYVHSPDRDLKDLLTIIKTYLGTNSTKYDQVADDIARLYMNTKRLAEEKRLVDGANEVPHFSLRTLTRVLSYVNTIAPSYGIRRAMFEGFSMGFLTLLDRTSEDLLVPLIHHHLLDKQGNGQSILSQPPKQPGDGSAYVRFCNKARDRQYWLFQGNEQIMERDDYIITPYVERNLLNLVRATSTRKFPILIQGPTSAGKTSMIEYLANFTGNKFVRINNHEHTDLQEYLGTYVSGPDGKLKFQEGVLVQAMRQGHWIVLDELNLAPTDVLEALNRLLDDNRELLIPETQEVVKPHENFILFATQNPPGLYGGRKVLSHAFRNRFLELHYDDIPEDELEFILQQRSRNTSPPDCRRIVTVYKELSRLRQTSRLFEQKDSFATLRDLFRWALRDAETREEIAAHGFMLLAERIRNSEERDAVKEVIERVFKVQIAPHSLYSSQLAPELRQLAGKSNAQGVVWTYAMRRLYVLLSRALRNKEPVLLVGETGCGKTTVCQLLAGALGKQLHIVNAHQNTETGDLIGSQRPVRNRGAILETLNSQLFELLSTMGADTSGSVEQRLATYRTLDRSLVLSVSESLQSQIDHNEIRGKALFEWSDGALVEAMRDGSFFLLDEISLADDSVLERLNSVLEPSRTLLLAEKGIDNSFVAAADGFQFFATMNPGGDFGKKELSPALRNRFTEIWVPPLSNDDDISEIVREKLHQNLKHLVKPMVDFATWFGQRFRSMAATPFSVREILVWVQFINMFGESDPMASLVHGASTVFIDSIGANPSAMMAMDAKSVAGERASCLYKLGELLGQDVASLYQREPEMTILEDRLSIGGFSLARERHGSQEPSFAFHAPTTRLNAMRVLRALQMTKPVLLEGSPGVGKTTLIAALARTCGQPLTRINLSDQTDLMDLFGTDVPVEGAEAGHFAWRDAPFLQAMQRGEWVLLDEMNLASQSVLEGLNACLDHRGEIYISELDQVFKRHPDFRLFAAQNPHHQGGGRKGLPASFVNRFIVVYADVFTDHDLQLIAGHSFPGLPASHISQLIRFVSLMEQEIMVAKAFGSQGGPWEFNLRDVLRWLSLMSSSDRLLHGRPASDFFDMIVRQRFRTPKDRTEVSKIFASILGQSSDPPGLYHDINSTQAQVGLALLARNSSQQPGLLPNIDIRPRLREVESIMICVKQNIPCIVGGASGTGKSALVKHVAALAGKQLIVFPMNADVDAMDLVGGFEQADPLRKVNATLRDLRSDLQKSVLEAVPHQAPAAVLELLNLLEGEDYVDRIAETISAVRELLDALTPGSGVALKLDQALHILQQPLELENPSFEWLDGVIVKALELGQWLVLDNANMCNASVLDRLNSLLEPDGFLSINEHCGPGGEPRIVKPHPEFRIFLTLDPKYGELSRAMRNRAVEIYLQDQPPCIDSAFGRVTGLESSLQRFKTLLEQPQQSAAQEPNTVSVALDHLSLEDNSVLRRFSEGFLQQNSRLHFSIQQQLAFFQTPSGSKDISSLVACYATLLEASSMSRIYSQPVHILNNDPLTHLAQHASFKFLWQSVSHDAALQLYETQKILEACHIQAKASKPNVLTRLQRSLVSDKVATFSKDSTVNLARFLAEALGIIRDFLFSDVPGLTTCMHRAISLKLLTRYLQRSVVLSNGDHGQFDEAMFQAHVSQGLRLLTTQTTDEDSLAQDFLISIRNKLEGRLNNEFKLNTGLGMDVLWPLLRSLPMSQKQVLDRTMELRHLGLRLDDLRWSTGAPLSSLSKASRTFTEAYGLTRRSEMDTSSLIKDLFKEVESLERRVREQDSGLCPYFVHEFETLRQTHTLRALGTTDQTQVSTLQLPEELLMLSNSPTQSQMRLAASSGSGFLLQCVDSLSYQDQYPWDGKLFTSLWSKLQDMNGVPLNSLALLESEMPALGKHVAKMAPELTKDPIPSVNKILRQLLLAVFRAFNLDSLSTLFASPSPNYGKTPWQTVLQERTAQLLSTAQESLPEYLHQILADHLVPSAAALSQSQTSGVDLAKLSAFAWLHFSIGALQLFVPDRPFDPQLRPLMERQLLEDTQTQLQEEISVLESFERTFTGQPANARTRVLADISKSLGPAPRVIQPVFRPQLPEISRLQAEFSNILRVGLGPSVRAMLEVMFQGHAQEAALDSEDVQLTRENLLRLYDRITSKFDAYEDLTLPTANLLRCLLVGISLSQVAEAAAVSPLSRKLISLTPFTGCTSRFLEPIDDDFRGIEFLQLMKSFVSIHGISGLSSNLQEAIFASFHGLYNEWDKKLKADRKAEALNSSLFRFKGGLEDEEEVDEEDFNALFPTYTGDETDRPSATKNADQVRIMSLVVAKLHRDLFLDVSEPITALKDTVKATVKAVVEDIKKHSFVDRSLNNKLFPGVLLLLDEQATSLTTETTDKSYNFYSDANLPEARKLVNLVSGIRTRFRDLQLVDEIGHMQPLEDVVQACGNLLELVHTDPLARLLPKVEQLHALVYEWQFGGWASKVFGVPTHHQALTDTVIRWRRLELSTWANLFDMEQTKCEEDAYSWWFVAYQVVIAVPLSMVDSASELKAYAGSLFQTLETYFSTAIVGQFRARISLLTQLCRYLDHMTKSYTNLKIIGKALANFIDFYQRFGSVVDEAIRKGRANLEKNMKDVLLMASWKDTNIAALRESARRSHQKLFRLVKKFRGMLGQEMKTLLDQGLPDEPPSLASQQQTGPVADHDVHRRVWNTINKNLSGWLDKHKRLANITRTTRIMREIHKLSSLRSDAPEILDSFRTDLGDSIAALRKETPSTLTDQNKELVKHLKTRKRKLFAETLRSLRNMGFKHNLSMDRLAEQDSLSAVLAILRPLAKADDAACHNSTYYLYKLLDILPRARGSAREHHEDLTGAEAARSIGFVEGMLSHLLSQRRKLSEVCHNFKTLQTAAADFDGLSNPKGQGIVSSADQIGDTPSSSSWLLHGLKFASHLLQLQSKYSSQDSTSLVQELDQNAVRVQSHLDSLQELGADTIPGITTSYRQTEHIQLVGCARRVKLLVEQNPEHLHILHHLDVWIRPIVYAPPPRSTNAQMLLDEYAASLSRFCDRILTAMEQVKKLGSTEITTRVDEAGWLVHQDEHLSRLIDGIHVREIWSHTTKCLTQLQQLDLSRPETGVTAACLLSLGATILKEYLALCQHLVKQLMEVHRATAELAYNLTKTFTQIASQGFCAPQEKSDQTSNEAGQLESGTGLGDGEGAEDISKDVQPDEDLSELAQEANKEQNDDVEDEKDAVDMADEELEGEMGSVDGAENDEENSQKGDENEEDDAMDEEVGDVDDLDPTAVDEKMWDGKDEDDAEKDQQGDKAKGQKQDEQVAPDDDGKKAESGEEPEAEKEADESPEDVAEETEDVKAQEDLNRQEQTADQNDTLALPEEMELDFEEKEMSSEDGLDDLSDVEEDGKEAEPEIKQAEDGEDEEAAQEDSGQLQNAEDEEPEAELPEEADGQNEGDEVQEDPKTEEEEKAEADDGNEGQDNPTEQDLRNEDHNVDRTEDAAPSDVKSSGQDQNADSMELDDEFHNNAAKQEDGETGEGAADKDTSAGNQGAHSRRQDVVENGEQDDEAPESARADPFKKLGDALEKWHRQQSDIKQAVPEDVEESHMQHQQQDAEQRQQEFQHLQNNESAADAQAMGTADTEEAQPLDESMAIDEEKQDPSSHLMPEDQDGEAEQEADPTEPQEDSVEPKEAAKTDKDDPRSGVKTRKGNYNREPTPEENPDAMEKDDEQDEDNIQETSTQLSATHISDDQNRLRDYGESLQQWADFQAKTNALSMSLTSQLRLILTPSQSTKLSGSFRTGKRLNIKRIIPYIASSYKRDKIWMRRAIPTKRTYQILLCVDDSKSMGESSSGTLAMESLVMVARSLTMLEAGQIGVMGFGSDVFPAHGLAEPFGSDAGAKVLQHFNFSQDRTDIALLIRQTIDTFRSARLQQSGKSDLWQLSLILSDGLTPSSAHDSIRRLLREAIEERIMIVFIIMDDTGKKKGDSVLELKEAKFVNEGGESKVVIERYLDTFPFQYYLIVHNLEELPSALAGLLRTWFAEITL